MKTWAMFPQSMLAERLFPATTSEQRLWRARSARTASCWSILRTDSNLILSKKAAAIGFPVSAAFDILILDVRCWILDCDCGAEYQYINKHTFAARENIYYLLSLIHYLLSKNISTLLRQQCFALKNPPPSDAPPKTRNYPCNSTCDVLE